MGQRYQYSTNWVKNGLEILHIFEALAIFYYAGITKTLNQSNNLENIEVSLWQLYPHLTKKEKNIMAIVDINGAGAIFLLFYANQDTGSEFYEI